MKLGTLVKVGALAVAAGSTAIGTVMVTTKALAKVEKKPAEEPIDTSNGPIINRPYGEEAPAYTAPIPEPVVEPAPAFAAPEPVSEPEPAPAFVAPEPTPAPVFAEPEPVPMPVFTAPEPEPVSFANAPVEPIVEPVEVELPTIEPPVAEPIPEPEPAPTYTDIGYHLPYAAANAGADDSIVIGGARVEEPAPVVEEPTPVVVVEPAPIVEEPTPVVVVEPAPIVAEPAPIVEEPVPVVAEPAPVAEEPAPIDLSALIAPNPVAESVVEPAPAFVAPEPVVEPVAEPEVVISIAEPIAEELTPEPTIAEPVFDDTLIPQQPTIEPEPAPIFAEPAPIVEPVVPASEPEPVTFGDLPIQNEYVEELPPMSEPEPEPVPAEPEPIPEPVVDSGKEAKIGDTIVSDKASNPNIAAVSSKFGIPANNLVSIEAAGNMPMVFEFLYSDIRNDATLVSVYFMMNGEATLPPETDKENVLAFGRNFITGNDELKAFLI